MSQHIELVRGNVKATMKELGASSADQWNVPPHQIKFVEGFNPRVHNAEYEAHIEEIKRSIIENGYYQDKPIAGFVANDPEAGQVVFCTDGHSRVVAALRAIKEGAPLETIPVVVKPRGTTMEDLNIALITSNEGKPFTPYEKGLVIKRLIDIGMTEPVIAKRLGLTGQYVGDLLALVGAPKAIRDMVGAGQVSATAAITELKKHGPKAVDRLQEGLKVAASQGRTKMTRKHMRKGTATRPALRIKGSVPSKFKVGVNTLTIVLDNPLDVELIKGNRVKLVITEDEEL